MNQLRTFVLGIAVTFGLPWALLIVAPSLYMSGLEPQPVYEDGEIAGFYPDSSPADAAGKRIYAREGCANCHTQMIRPQGLGEDIWRQGWGREQEDFAQPIRPTRPRDFLGEDYALLGQQRHGPDLSSVGFRIADPNALYLHLYAPRAVHAWSNMPSFRHLFEERESRGTAGALDLPEGYAPAGKEVIPSSDARVLVRYLLSLKKDGPVPAE